MSTYVAACAPRVVVNARGRRCVYPDLMSRFFANVRQDGDCWRWTKTLTDDGYAPFYLARAQAVRAHRWIYELLRAEIPDGLQLDHLCRVRDCVNPWHMDVVTSGVNTRRGLAAVTSWHARKDRCKNGHPFDVANTYVHPVTGHRICRACRANRERMRRWAA